MSKVERVCVECESEYRVIALYSEGQICRCPFCGADHSDELDEDQD